MSTLNFEVTNGDSDVLHGLHESARLTTDALCDAGDKPQPPQRNLATVRTRLAAGTGVRVVRQVEAQPMRAALVAAAPGLIIGMMLPRR